MGKHFFFKTTKNKCVQVSKHLTGSEKTKQKKTESKLSNGFDSQKGC